MKTHSISVSFVTLALLGIVASASNTEAKGRSYGKAAPFSMAQLPAGELKAGLDKLGPKEYRKAMEWLHEISFSEGDAANHLRVDPSGGIYTICPDDHGCGDHCDHDQESIPMADEAEIALPSGAGNAPVSVNSPPVFNSRPGAPYHLYLDFNGAIVSGTAWNQSDGVATWNCLAWSDDSDLSTFSDAEQAEIRRIWERIAEDFAPFDINVTTDVSYDPDNYGGNRNKVGWLLFTPTKDSNNRNCPHAGAGGVAYLSVFGESDYASTYQPAWVNSDMSVPNMAEAGSHEIGHNMGLSHDGTSTLEYYGGHAATANAPSWGPLMGTGYSRDISQWSKGEYYDSNRNQDDLAIIANRVPYRADDHGNSGADATVWESSAIDQEGVVETTGDPDFFRFFTGAGNITFSAKGYRCDSSTWGGNLDIQLELYDASMNLVASDNPEADTDASITETVAAGVYYLVVKPSDAGDPMAASPSGYASYGSLGQYRITGQVVDEDAILITSPVGGELWAGGTTREITWTSVLGGNVKIELMKNGELESVIVNSTANTGVFPWDIPPAQAVGSDYRVKITSVESPLSTDASTWDFTISPDPLPEIAVLDPNRIEMVDGAASLDFGNVDVNGFQTMTLAIRNTGTASLTGIVASVGGANAGDFSLGNLGTTTLAPGEETTIDVLFLPLVTGDFVASLQIESNDSNESPFDIVLRGAGVSPEIAIEESGQDLTDGVSTVSYPVTLLGDRTVKTFTVRNLGSADLTNLSLFLSGADAAEYILGRLSANRLAPGESATFTVAFRPTAEAGMTANLAIFSNDGDEDPFDLVLYGEGLTPPSPDITIEGPDGDELVSGLSLVDFNSVEVGKSVTRTFIVRNDGTLDLSGLVLTVGGSDDLGFTVGSLGKTDLIPGEETSFSVTFTAAEPGASTTYLEIASNDPNENPFHFTIRSGGIWPPAPEIVVEQPEGRELTSSLSTINFGTLAIGESVVKTVTIRNTGSAALRNLVLTRTGVSADAFDLQNLKTELLAVGEETSFQVTFSPAASGNFSADLRISSNDEDEESFIIALSGVGAPEAVPLEQKIAVVTKPGSSKELKRKNLRKFKTIKAGSTSKALVFSILNKGKKPLRKIKLQLSGKDRKQFRISKLKKQVLGRGKKTRFRVFYTPRKQGSHSAILKIRSNDPSMKKIEIRLKGRARGK